MFGLPGSKQCVHGGGLACSGRADENVEYPSRDSDPRQRIGLILTQHQPVGIGLVGDPDYYCRFGFAARPGLVCDGVPDIYVQALAFIDVPAWSKITFHPAFFGAA